MSKEIQIGYKNWLQLAVDLYYRQQSSARLDHAIDIIEVPIQGAMQMENTFQDDEEPIQLDDEEPVQADNEEPVRVDDEAPAQLDIDGPVQPAHRVPMQQPPTPLPAPLQVELLQPEVEFRAEFQVKRRKMDDGSGVVDRQLDAAVDAQLDAADEGGHAAGYAAGLAGGDRKGDIIGVDQKFCAICLEYSRGDQFVSTCPDQHECCCYCFALAVEANYRKGTIRCPLGCNCAVDEDLVASVLLQIEKFSFLASESDEGATNFGANLSRSSSSSSASSNANSGVNDVGSAMRSKLHKLEVYQAARKKQMPLGFGAAMCPKGCAPVQLCEGVVSSRPGAHCLECKGIFCGICKEIYHYHENCQTVEHLLAKRVGAKEKKLEQLKSHLAILRGSVLCPGCNQPVQRSEGCNHMKCVCGTTFCYACGKERGRGSTCKCGYYTEQKDEIRDENKKLLDETQAKADAIVGELAGENKEAEEKQESSKLDSVGETICFGCGAYLEDDEQLSRCINCKSFVLCADCSNQSHLLQGHTKAHLIVTYDFRQGRPNSFSRASASNSSSWSSSSSSSSILGSIGSGLRSFGSAFGLGRALSGLRSDATIPSTRQNPTWESISNVRKVGEKIEADGGETNGGGFRQRVNPPLRPAPKAKIQPKGQPKVRAKVQPKGKAQPRGRAKARANPR